MTSTLQHSEQLQETLLHLEKMRRQEQRRRRESDAVLTGFSALISANTHEQVLAILCSIFEDLTGCHDCLVLQRQGDRLVSEPPTYSFPIARSFNRVLTENATINAFDVSQIPEWQSINTSEIQSALHLPLHLSTTHGMLILTSTTRAAFSRESIELALRIIPFAEQALARIAYIEQLHNRELETQRQLMRLIMDHAPVGIFMLDKQGHVLFVNQAFSQALGITETRFLQAEHYDDILPPQLAEQFTASFNACFTQRQPVETEEMIPCTDGSQHTFNVIKVPVKNADGEIYAIIGIAVDITDKLKLANDREQMHQQLLHTQKLESLGVLAGGIAHDFNNILTAILGNASLAENKFTRDPMAVEQHIHKIVSATEKAGELCKQMLAYSGHGQFVTKPINISQLIESIVNILEVSLNKGVILKLSLQQNLPLIEADGSQLHQVIMNLITNANEAINTNSGVISIRTGMMNASAPYLQHCLCAENIKPGNFVFVEVADTGSGMSAETIKKIFDPFFTTKFTGRGLGMSAVLGIIRGHHGAIKIYSERNQGTTFRALFPALNYTEQNNDKNMVGVTQQLKSAVVMVVDDEESIREITTMMLSEAGINQVLTAEDGQQALQLYKQTDNIDLILLDLTMPHMDGEETFRQLRLINPDVKVILISGYSKQSLQERFAGKGLCGFVQKPFSNRTLYEIVSRILS